MQKLVWIVSLLWVATRANLVLIPREMGVCEFDPSFPGNELIDVSQDLQSVDMCPQCGDIFGVNGVGICAQSPCDGLKCFGGGEYRVPFETQNKCGYMGALQQDCSQCDTECLGICDVLDPDYKAKEDELVICAFNLNRIGRTNGALCSGTVGFSYCDDAEANNRTCYVGQVTDNDIDHALVWENCAPVFSRVNDDMDFWACPMDSPVSGNVDIHDTPYCDEFAQRYGEPMNNGYYPGEEDLIDGNTAAARSGAFYLV